MSSGFTPNIRGQITYVNRFEAGGRLRRNGPVLVNKAGSELLPKQKAFVVTREAGVSVEPGVERSGTPGTRGHK